VSSESSPPILVVDDDPLVLAAVNDVLRPLGHSVIFARSLAEADRMLELGPMLALVDVHLPDGSGDTWSKKLRLDPKWHALPLIAMTSRESAEVVRRCFVAGADDFLSKPIDAAQLAAKVRAVSRGLQTAPRPRLASKRVALLTEQVFIGTLLQRLIENSGHEARRASTVRELATEPHFDAAVIDLELPHALALSGALGAAPPPIIAVTPGGVDGTRPPFATVAVHDPELELEHVVKQLNTVLSGGYARTERRLKPRVPFCSVVRFRFYGDRPWQVGYGYDLSETGLFVRTTTPIASREPVEVQFKLEEDGPTLEAKGLVIWNTPFGPRDLASYPYGMGLAFADFPSEEWARVHEYVQGHSPKKLS
jgi:DNA-binding response OmpR family regulator